MKTFSSKARTASLVFAPSYSPENAAKNTGSQAGINATMDIALAKELLTNLGAACETLNIEADGRRRWKDMLAKLPAYRINADGAVAEWAWPGLDDDYEHRHSSHLIPLFDGTPPDIAANPNLREAFKKALDMRMRHRLAQKEQEMAFGLVQLGQAAAGLREAKTAARIVDWLANEFWLPSLAPTHNTRSIFNVDICGGLPAVVIRMLFQSELGRLDFLPALPGNGPRDGSRGCRDAGRSSLRASPGSPARSQPSFGRPRTNASPSARRDRSGRSRLPAAGSWALPNHRIAGWWTFAAAGP